MGSSDLYMTRRASLDAPWKESVNLGPFVNTPAAEFRPHLSADNSTLYWDSDRFDGHGDFDIWQIQIILGENSVNVTDDI